jgi:flagellar motor switch protein FliN
MSQNGGDEGLDDAWAAAMEEQGVKPDAPAEEEVASPHVQRAPLEYLEPDIPMSSDSEEINLGVILDVPVELSMEIGRTKISIRNLLHLNQGSVVELDRLAGEPLDVMVNGTLIAHGEVVVVNDRFGIRLTDVISPAERVKKLR